MSRFFAFDQEIIKILNWLKLPLDQSRWDNWLHMYQQWKESNGYRFYENLDTIVDDIISGTSHELAQYNMSVIREASLIYTLNERGISIDCNTELMPANTLAWHELIN
jgi:hypothetical protein